VDEAAGVLARLSRTHLGRRLATVHRHRPGICKILGGGTKGPLHLLPARVGQHGEGHLHALS